MLRPFLIALLFLTRIPIPHLRDIQDQEISYSLRFYPLVGLIIGLLIMLAAVIFSGVSEWLAAALVLVTWVVITGGLHLDGLADSADAWIGGFADRERTLQIMKDPNCGPMAVVFIVLLLLTKCAAIEVMIGQSQWVNLMIAPIIARTFIPVLFLTTKYVRPGGLGNALSVQQQPLPVWVVVIGVIAVIVSLLGKTGIVMSLGALAALVVMRSQMVGRIGGTTGDTAGAAVEIMETTALVCAAYVSQ